MASPSVHVLSLPPEILLEIFSHLPIGDLIRAAAVCKDWNRVACAKRLWKKVTYDMHLITKMDPNLIPSLVQKGIQRFNVFFTGSDTCVRHLEIISGQFPNAVALIIFCSCVERSLAAVLGRLTFDGVLELTLRGNCSDLGLDNKAEVRHIATAFPRLEALDLAVYGLLSSSMISRNLGVLLQEWTGLKRLKLEIPTQIGVIFPSAGCKLYGLRRLHFFGMRIDVERTFKTVRDRFVNLRELQLDGCKFINGWGGLQYLSHVPQVDIACTNTRFIPSYVLENFVQQRGRQWTSVTYDNYEQRPKMLNSIEGILWE